VWTSLTPAVVLGCAHRHLQGKVARRLAGRAEVVLRESGGGAVLAGPWLVSASVVLPHGHPWVRGGLMDSYRRMGQLHVAVLERLGITALALPPLETQPHQAASSCAACDVPWASFGSLSPWEVVDSQGRKLVGLAQRRRKSGVLLVAGTLVSCPDWPLLCAAMSQPRADALLPAHGVRARAGALPDGCCRFRSAPAAAAHTGPPVLRLNPPADAPSMSTFLWIIVL
jgi:lipoate---protein ligase